MSDGQPELDESASLRRNAEEALERRVPGSRDLKAQAPEALRHMIHELEVHRLELEMQAQELRRTQAALETEQARYVALYDRAPVGYVALNDSGVILSANLTIAAQLGVDRATLAKQPFSRFVHSEDKADHYRAVQRILASGAPETYQLRLRRAGADPFWARIEATAATDEDGAPICLAVVSDVSAKVEADRELKRSALAYRTLAENIPDLLARFDAQLRHLYVNRAAAQAGTLSREECVGKTLAESGVPAPVAQRWEDRIRAAFVTGEMTELEAEYPTPAGPRFFHTLVVPERGEYGQVRSVITLARDITGRKQAEAERERLQTNLAQSDRLASMGVLAAGVAHEINNPLAYSLFNVQGLAEDLPRLAGAAARLRDHLGESALAAVAGDGADLLEPGALHDAADRAREALDGLRRIQAISRNLGNYSRGERVEPTAIELTAAIERALSMAHNEIRYRARLVKVLDQVPRVWASEGKLSQVFLNLLMNAAQAIDAGDAEHHSITIRTWAEGDSVFAEVANTGKLIPPEEQARIFEPFFTTKKVGEGQGLGLAICRSIIDGFGGDIRVESQPGTGTRFTIRLRAAPADATKLDEAAQAKPDVRAARGRVLVVDDEPGVRRILQRLLGKEHDVVTAGSGEEACELIQRDGAFDIVLCDLMMPGISGVGLHEWLAKHDAALAGRLVFVTGGVFMPRVAEYLKASGCRVLDKPMDNERVKSVVAELVAEAKRTS